MPWLPPFVAPVRCRFALSSLCRCVMTAVVLLSDALVGGLCLRVLCRVSVRAPPCVFEQYRTVPWVYNDCTVLSIIMAYVNMVVQDC